MSRHFLDPLFNPASIALFGASESGDAAGAIVLRNLLEGGFAGPLYAINPEYRMVRGIPCRPTLDGLMEPVDLALIATAPKTVPEVLRDCGRHRVKAAIIVSAGFGEHDRTGKMWSRGLVEEARRAGLRLLGPNCLGLFRPSRGLNATFSNNRAGPGSLAMISQSGALCTAVLDWADGHGIGFSLVVSMGSAVDVDFGDVLDYLAIDTSTHSVLVYLEGLGDARRFISGLRAAARVKPVVVIKAGRHVEGSHAAMFHSGALVGSDDVFNAALERAGVVRADTIEQLFAAAQMLSSSPRIRGDRLAIITNSGGPGVMATDCAEEHGIRLAGFAQTTMAELDERLPEDWSHGNPIAVPGEGQPEHYRAAVSACLGDEGVDGILAMLCPQARSQPAAAAQAVIDASAGASKPVLACWLGERQVEAGRKLFAAAGIPAFVNPETAIKSFGYLVEYQRNQRMLMQTPGPLAELERPDIDGAQLIIEGALASRRNLLTPMETRAILQAFRIPAIPALTARSATEALAAAECLGFPVAMKVLSPDILHKSDVDGVRLNVECAESVRHVYADLIESVSRSRPDVRIEGVGVEKMYRRRHGRELFVGVIQDSIFGPVIGFGAGGTAVEVLRDRAIALPPLNEHLARSLIGKTRVARLLGAFRNLPAIDERALIRVLLRISEMVCELPQILALDINPLVADDAGVCALDARIIAQRQPPGRHRYAHMAIHPYPGHWVRRWRLHDGREITIRPIRPEDAEIEQQFVRRLSPEARYWRFMQTLNELSPELLVRLTQLDYHRELALIATVPIDGRETEVAVARFFPDPDGVSAEFAIVVADEWQRLGIGMRLMDLLIEAARDKGYSRMEGEVLAQNAGMLKFIEKLGFVTTELPDDPAVKRVAKTL